MESNCTENKRELTDSLEKEIVAFLNYPEGGVIYLGIDKSGSVVGLVEYLHPVRNQLETLDSVEVVKTSRETLKR